jgi:hypothetical protein
MLSPIKTQWIAIDASITSVLFGDNFKQTLILFFYY